MLNQDYMMRKMTAKDLEQIISIEKTVFTMPWSQESYSSELKNSFAHYLVADMVGKVVAYGGIWVVFEEAHITNIAVHVDYQHQGLGKSLLKGLEQIALQKKADHIYLEVRPSNLTAINMYESLGYGQSGLRKSYYPDNGENAIIMSKLLF
jgi:ribosomal-protein-alanine N-acetyltransferase